jgi:hypothetical protein
LKRFIAMNMGPPIGFSGIRMPRARIQDQIA